MLEVRETMVSSQSFAGEMLARENSTVETYRKSREWKGHLVTHWDTLCAQLTLYGLGFFPAGELFPTLAYSEGQLRFDSIFSHNISLMEKNI